MIPRTAARVCTVLVLFGWGAGTVAAQAGGGGAKPPALPAGVQQIVEFEQMRALEPQIRAFAEDRFRKLVGEAPEARGAARKDLADSVSRQLQPNPLFLTTFGRIVNDVATDALKGASPAGRLNVAIAVARVAEPMENASLAPVVQALVSDESEAVVLWGMKAAGPVLAHGAPPPLLAAVGKAAAAQAKSGPVTDEAYVALTAAQFRPNPPANFAQQVMPLLLQLFQNRVQQYKTGVPPDAGAENKASGFFATGQVWPQMQPAQQVQAVQGISDLVTLAAAQFAAGQRDATTPVLRGTGSALAVIGSYVKNPAAASAGQALTRVTAGTRPEQVKQLAADAVAALRAQDPFTNLKPAPEVTVPTTAETPPVPAAPATAATAGQ
ncbi:MAG TPA: hypothetical protein VK324_15860 [Tepidisphaeraceae bacterium]|nr:hypothetical protein [Tepidisphaeraceae bacterium]